MGAVFENLTEEELCDLMCGSPENEIDEMDIGVIYIFKCIGYYKIGKAKIGSKRYGEYTKLMEKPTYIFKKVCKEYSKVEKLLHNYFAEKCTNGEYFLLDEEDLQKSEELIKDYFICDLSEYTKKNKKSDTLFDGNESNGDHIYILHYKNEKIFIEDGWAIPHEFYECEYYSYNYCPRCGSTELYLTGISERYAGCIRCKECDKYITAGSRGYEKYFNPYYCGPYKKDENGEDIIYKYYPAIKYDNKKQIIRHNAEAMNIDIYGYSNQEVIQAFRNYIVDEVNSNKNQINKYNEHIMSLVNKNEQLLSAYNNCLYAEEV